MGRTNAPLRLMSAVVATAVLAAGCDQDTRPTVRVFAAASLTAPFGALVDAFESQRPDLHIELHCAGTPQLVLQLRQGAPADVFASADSVQMQRVVEAGCAAGAPRPFVGNTLAIVTQAGNPKAITRLGDLARDGVTSLLCAPEVPAGRYARAALERAQIAVTSASDEPSVRAVASKVELGIADAGIVYRTDALAAAGRLDTISIPEHHNVVATYPIVATATGEQTTAGQAFVAFVLGAEGQRILTEHGFVAP